MCDDGKNHQSNDKHRVCGHLRDTTAFMSEQMYNAWIMLIVNKKKYSLMYKRSHVDIQMICLLLLLQNIWNMTSSFKKYNR